jgi:hypothetical protein
VPRTSTAAEATRLIDAFVQVSIWTPASVEAVLGAKLSHASESTHVLSVQAARFTAGPFDSVSLRLPTNEAKNRDARVAMEVAERVSIKRAERQGHLKRT